MRRERLPARVGDGRDGEEREPDEQGGFPVIVPVIGGIGGDVPESAEKACGGIGGIAGGEVDGGLGRDQECGECGRGIRTAEMGELGEVDALTAVMGAGVEAGAVGETRLKSLEEGLEDHVGAGRAGLLDAGQPILPDLVEFDGGTDVAQAILGDVAVTTFGEEIIDVPAGDTVGLG
jgi:hypothetical protein